MRRVQCYEMVYGAKPDVTHLRAFGAPCAIIEVKERLKKLDDLATMCHFVGYKYERGGYRVWDPKGRVVNMAEALRRYAEARLSILSWDSACVRSA